LQYPREASPRRHLRRRADGGCCCRSDSRPPARCPNNSCAEHPHAIVPLPSTAIETLPATGSGLPGLTGIATPSTTSAAAYTGTGLPPICGCVAIGAVVVLLSSTGTVIGYPFPRQIAHRPRFPTSPRRIEPRLPRRDGHPGPTRSFQIRSYIPGSVANLSGIALDINSSISYLGNDFSSLSAPEAPANPSAARSKRLNELGPF
jgi:hypothetical protein